jgi:hypothetical protein
MKQNVLLKYVANESKEEVKTEPSNYFKTIMTIRKNEFPKPQNVLKDHESTPKPEMKAALEKLKQMKVPMSPYLTRFVSKMTADELTNNFKSCQSLRGTDRNDYWRNVQRQLNS